MPRKRSLVTQRKGSSNWYENFTVGGYRFRGSLETDDREQAEIIAAQIRSDALLGRLTGKKPEITLSHALGRYLIEHGQYLASAGDIKRMGLRLITELGKHQILSYISSADLSAYAGRRRAAVSNRSVNIELEHLRAVVRRAGEQWDVGTPEINWQALLLEEAGDREHVLSTEEETRLFAALRADYHPMVRFALATGARLSNVLNLSWRQIDWDAGLIAFRVKSRKPRGDLHYTPITNTVMTLLSSERGNHPEYVFTFVCAANRYDPHHDIMHMKGTRYPFTQTGWRRPWAKALKKAGIEDFRFHDLRHTAATRALRAHRNLRTIQRMLGHKDIATTLRYVRSDVDDVRSAMEAVEEQYSGNMPTLIQTQN